MVDIKETVSAMCKGFAGGRSAMAAALGMNLDQFNNSLYEKGNCRFFSHAVLERMEDLSGTSLLAEYQAGRKGLLTISIPVPDQVDNVELFHAQMQADATKGLIAQAQMNAREDGVIDRAEAGYIIKMWKKYTKQSFGVLLGCLVLNGAPSDAIETLVGRRVEGYQFAASSPRCE